jgi:hypothetical protein
MAYFELHSYARNQFRTDGRVETCAPTLIYLSVSKHLKVKCFVASHVFCASK